MDVAVHQLAHLARHHRRRRRRRCDRFKTKSSILAKMAHNKPTTTSRLHYKRRARESAICVTPNLPEAPIENLARLFPKPALVERVKSVYFQCLSTFLRRHDDDDDDGDDEEDDNHNPIQSDNFPLPTSEQAPQTQAACRAIF